MNTQQLLSIFFAFVLIASGSASPSTGGPRKSPEFTIHEPSGKTTMLSSLNGKVVVLEFLFIRSEHCLRVARMLNKLQGELGSRGFQPVGITFDPPNGNTGVQLVSYMVDYFKLTYPIGYSAKADVDTYLGRSGNQTLNIPQIVVIDRTGMIRATSGGPGGDPKLEDENSLRNLINNLLEEGKASSPNRR
jgi:cytochrome oxidase Cu insertion factor (SCO1/SenC/PrrC family)